MAALLRDGGRSEEAAAALRFALRASGGPSGFAVAARAFEEDVLVAEEGGSAASAPR